jgi:hypothetical protein
MSQDNNQLRIIWSIFLVVVAAALLASGVLLFVQAMGDLKEAFIPETAWRIGPFQLLLVLLVQVAVIAFIVLVLLRVHPWLPLIFLTGLVILIFYIPLEKIPIVFINIDKLVRSLVTFVLSFVAFALAGWTIIILVRRHLRLALTLIGVLLIAAIAVKTHLLQK